MNSNLNIDNISFNLIRQKFNTKKIDDVREKVLLELNSLNLGNLAGKSIGITAGSRGIANIPEITKAIVDFIKDKNGSPFIIPSMGSHGGGTASGQKSVLNSLGINEKNMGCPIRSSMEVIEIGKTNNKAPVYVDKLAYESDGVIVVNRIKPHTDFSSNLESGLIKMMSVGLGNQKGCSTMHAYGLRETIPTAAKVIMKNVNILCGLGIVENSKDQTSELVGVRPEEFFEREEEMLIRAKENVPQLPLNQIDVLIVQEIGKMISGTGMDTKVIGRMKVAGEIEPEFPDIDKLVVLNIASNSYGNALGIGLADLISKKVFDQIDFEATYTNIISTTFLERGKIPLVLDTDKKAVNTALQTSRAKDNNSAKVVLIKNTLDLSELYISNGALNNLDMDKVTILKENIKIELDDNKLIIKE